MGAACGSLVCDKDTHNRRRSSEADYLEGHPQQLNSGETVPGDPVGNIELKDIDHDFNTDDKDKNITLQSSPINRGPTDPAYFSPEELAYYEKEKRKEMSSDNLLRPKRSKIVWKQGDPLGSGSYGEVVMGLNQMDGNLMAVKKVRIEEMSGRNKSKIEALEQEISMYERLKHKNIVGYLGYERTKNYFNIFLEYVEGGSLLDNVNKFGGALSENVVINYTKQVLAGLEYLHSHEVIHRDLKAANVLVDRNGVCKLADFGTAKSVHELNGQNNTLTGTLHWMAPEVIQQQAYGRAADIWSIGCTVFEMVNGHPPWHNAGNIYQVMSKVVNSDEDPVFTQPVSDVCKAFISCCLRRRPEERLNVYKLIRHPFLNVHKSYSKKTTAVKDKDSLELFFEDSTPPKGSEELSFENELHKQAGTEVSTIKDFKQIAFKYRQSTPGQPNKEVAAPEKDYTFETPYIIDSQGRQRIFTRPNMGLEKKSSDQATFQSERSTFRNSKVSFQKADENEPFHLKYTQSNKGSGPRKLRIPIGKQGNTSLESNNAESSRNLAINYKNRGLTLKVKADTNIGTRHPIPKSKRQVTEPSKDEYSDFDFDEDDHPEEVIHEVKITIKEKRRLLPPLARKPLKSQGQNKPEKTPTSVYEPKEADLLNNTPSREFFEVPKLVLGPIESEAAKGLRPSLSTAKTPLAKTVKAHHTPDDFLSLDINPSHRLPH